MKPVFEMVQEEIRRRKRLGLLARQNRKDS